MWEDLHVEGYKSSEAENFLGWWNYSALTLSWWTHVLTHLSTPTVRTPPRTSPDGNHGPWWGCASSLTVTNVPRQWRGCGKLGTLCTFLWFWSEYKTALKKKKKVLKKSYRVHSWSFFTPFLLRYMNVGIYKIQKVPGASMPCDFLGSVPMKPPNQ